MAAIKAAVACSLSSACFSSSWSSLLTVFVSASLSAIIRRKLFICEADHSLLCLSASMCEAASAISRLLSFSTCLAASASTCWRALAAH